ncbi:MAG: hypothetical protein LBT14_11870 [Treponema sp.]|jgi:hypothetical protein|nr:hypothetical protein [Treponema sp.]
MQELSFSLKDTRIFLDLKIREREHPVIQVQVAAVACSEESLLTGYTQNHHPIHYHYEINQPDRGRKRQEQ